MRILQVCSGTNNLERGAERFCLSITNSLSVSGHFVSLVTGTHVPSSHIHKNVPVIVVPEIVNPWLRKFCFDYFNPWAISKLKEHLDEFRPDIVHFHSLYGLSTALVRTARHFSPTVITLHDASLAFSDSGIVTPKYGLANSHLKIPHGYIHRVINRYHLRDANLVSPSRWLSMFFQNVGYNKPFHIPNGIVSTGRTTKYDKIVLWVGAMTTFKGLPHVIGSIAPLIANLGWRFVVIGDGPHRTSLSRLYPDVEFTGNQDPTPYYEKSSIVLVTSLGKENFPTVILEAMRHGVCVVGHKVGGIRELIENGENGFLYETNTTLKTILTKLLPELSMVQRLGRAGQIRFKNNYQLDTCLQKYIDLYSSLIQP